MEIKNREKFLAIACGVCIAIWLLNLFVINPLTASWKDRSKRIADLQKSIADGNQLLRRQSTVNDRWTHMQTNALPSSATQAESQLLTAFDRWVQDRGV